MLFDGLPKLSVKKLLEALRISYRILEVFKLNMGI
jgi:hypothetical protein